MSILKIGGKDPQGNAKGIGVDEDGQIIESSLKNSFNNRSKRLRFEVENKRGVFNQISTIDISDIFKSLTGWEDGSNADIEGSIHPRFKCIHIKKLPGEAYSEWRYNFTTPLVIANKAKYIRFWINVPDVSTLQNIDFYIYSNSFGGTHRHNLVATDLINGYQYIDLPLDRLDFAGTGTPDIYGAGIDRISFLVRATDTATETEFSVDRMEFIERKPFIMFFMDGAKEENVEDVSSYLIANNIPWNISLTVADIERLKVNPEAPASNVGKLSTLKKLIADHGMIAGLHLYATAFPPPEITQTGDGATPEITEFSLYSTDVFTTEAIKTHVDRHAGKYFLVSSPLADYYVWYNKDGGSEDPAVAGRTGIEVAIATGDTLDDIGTKTATAVGAFTGSFNSSYADRKITVTNTSNGAVTAPEVGTCPWGVTGFRESVRWASVTGTELDLFDNQYMYNAWATNKALNIENHRIARAVSAILRFTNDSPSSLSAISVDPVFAQGDSPISTNRFSYISQYTQKHDVQAQVLDLGFTPEQIENLFKKMLEEQVFITIYTHGTQRNQTDTRTPIETLEAFFRVYSEYKERIDCFSSKELIEMYNQIEPIKNPSNTVGGDYLSPPRSYRIKDDDLLI